MTVDYQHFQSLHLRVSADYDLAAATSGTVAGATIGVTARDANHRIYIQRIVFSPTTYSAKTLTFQDSANTPVPVALASVPAAAPTTGGVVSYVYDFGVVGTPLSKGKNLDMVLSGAGVAGRLHVEGYQKLEGTIAM